MHNSIKSNYFCKNYKYLEERNKRYVRLERNTYTECVNKADNKMLYFGFQIQPGDLFDHQLGNKVKIRKLLQYFILCN